MADESKYDERGNLNLMALDSSTQEIINLFAEGVIKALRVSGWVWNTDSLEWERAKQPATVDDLTNIENAVSDIRWKDIIIEDTEPKYIGYNETMGAATDASTWTIQKITVTGNTTRVKITTGAWDDRGVLF